jgi:hypothetical protein
MSDFLTVDFLALWRILGASSSALPISSLKLLSLLSMPLVLLLSAQFAWSSVTYPASLGRESSIVIVQMEEIGSRKSNVAYGIYSKGTNAPLIFFSLGQECLQCSGIVLLCYSGNFRYGLAGLGFLSGNVAPTDESAASFSCSGFSMASLFMQ